MLKKLTEEQRKILLTCAIEEFGDKGYGRAKISSIAHAAGISAGVIYKYYEDKEALFGACLEHCMEYLDEVYSKVDTGSGSLIDGMDQLVELAVIASGEHPEYFRLYHQVTLIQDPEEAKRLALRIEGRSSGLYVDVLEKARDAGIVRQDMDPGYFALLFDDILMMINFGLTSQYYRERMKLYLGREPEEEELREQVLSFIKSAFGMKEGK